MLETMMAHQGAERRVAERRVEPRRARALSAAGSAVMSVRLPNDVYDKADKRARQLGMTLSQRVRALIEADLRTS